MNKIKSCIKKHSIKAEIKSSVFSSSLNALNNSPFQKSIGDKCKPTINKYKKKSAHKSNEKNFDIDESNTQTSSKIYGNIFNNIGPSYINKPFISCSKYDAKYIRPVSDKKNNRINKSAQSRLQNKANKKYSRQDSKRPINNNLQDSKNSPEISKKNYMRFVSPKQLTFTNYHASDSENTSNLSEPRKPKHIPFTTHSKRKTEKSKKVHNNETILEENSFCFKKSSLPVSYKYKCTTVSSSSVDKFRSEPIKTQKRPHLTSSIKKNKAKNFKPSTANSSYNSRKKEMKVGKSRISIEAESQNEKPANSFINSSNCLAHIFTFLNNSSTNQQKNMTSYDIKSTSGLANLTSLSGTGEAFNVQKIYDSCNQLVNKTNLDSFIFSNNNKPSNNNVVNQTLVHRDNLSNNKMETMIISSKQERQLQIIKNIVCKAINEKKTFTVVGNYFPIRRGLIARGWIEKVKMLIPEEQENFKNLENLTCMELVDGFSNSELAAKYRRALISKLLVNHQVDFYWDLCSNPFNVNSDNIKQTIINRYPSLSARPYASKEALAYTLNYNSHWFCEEGKFNVLFPRTYNLALEHDKSRFINDFQITASISLLYWISTTFGNGVAQMLTSCCTIPDSVFKFAVGQCQNFLKIKQHKDIDEVIVEAKETEWTTFLNSFYKIVHNLNCSSSHCLSQEFLMQILESKLIIKNLEKYRPHLKYDGYMNLWIIKPHHGSQGYGITVCQTLKSIMDIIEKNTDRKYIIQKYIERPLLIYETKFDIRQWFLISHQPNLHVWMYRECYLRFSSQNYNLHKLHESIHLTNNSVQCKYKNCERDAALPIQNMWHSETFKSYLVNIGHPLVWQNIIYKGMKECIIGIIMCSQDKMSSRVNSYELWGTDFLLTEDFCPYIIEINTRPAMGATTIITTQMCPQVLNDLVKVIVDYSQDPKSSTGNFELIFEEETNIKRAEEKVPNLFVDGISYFTKYKTHKS